MERKGYLVREISVLETVRRRLRQDVAVLATEPPDADITEEIAHSVLGFVRPGDLVLAGRQSHLGP